MVLVICAAAVSLVVLCVFAARRTMRRRNAAPVRGQERPSRPSAELARFLATGEGPVLDRRIELHGLRRDGTEFPVELSIMAVKHGETLSFSAFVADITERKRSEAELRRYADVFRNMQVGLNVWCLQD